MQLDDVWMIKVAHETRLCRTATREWPYASRLLTSFMISLICSFVSESSLATLMATSTVRSFGRFSLSVPLHTCDATRHSHASRSSAHLSKGALAQLLRDGDVAVVELPRLALHLSLEEDRCALYDRDA